MGRAFCISKSLPQLLTMWLAPMGPCPQAKSSSPERQDGRRAVDVVLGSGRGQTLAPPPLAPCSATSTSAGLRPTGNSPAPGLSLHACYQTGAWWRHTLLTVVVALKGGGAVMPSAVHVLLGVDDAVNGLVA